MEKILKYIQQTYAPLSVILYGSYANGTNDLNSDFDALVISSDHKQCHDTTVIDHVPLDVFVYPASFFAEEYNCDDFIQIYDGQIICDSNNIGKNLQSRVQSYLLSRPCKTQEEIRSNVDWCVKMAERAKRGDAEGLFRWHWVLTDSLEIFCDVMQHPYFGPKKSLHWMKSTYPDVFDCYQKALQDLSMDSLDAWINYIVKKAV